MKPIRMFVLAACPYCKQAHAWMQELQGEYPAYRNLDIEVIDEGLHPDIASQHNYYYVPTYYVDGEKVHEGAATKDMIRSVFEHALA